MSTDSTRCRGEGCEQPRIPLSVFCEVHHAEQLQRLGVKILTPADRYQKKWDLRTRGITTDSELVIDFLMDVSPDSASDAFDVLPAGFQSLVSDYLHQHPPETLPHAFLFGPADQETLDRLTAQMRASAAVLLKRLTP